MVGVGGERRLRDDEVATILAAHGFGRERAETGPAVIALDAPLGVVWANADALRLFGADASAIGQRLFARRGRDSLRAAVAALAPEGGVRTERLRLSQGFRSRTLTVGLGRYTFPDGRAAIVVFAGAAGPDKAADPAFARDALGLTDPPAAFAPEPSPAPPPEAATAADPPPLIRRRFLWQTDAAHRVTALQDFPAGLDGHPTEDLFGQLLPAVLESLGSDPQRAVAAALDTRRPWSGVTLPWPAADGASHVPVTIGGIPMRDPAGDFTGFRGFGTAELAAETRSPLPRVRPETPTPLPPAAAERIAPAAGPSDIATTTPEAPAAEAPAAASPIDKSPDAVRVRASLQSAKIVALRPARLPAPRATGEPPGRSAERRDAAAPAQSRRAGDLPNLSFVERLNFGEIARTLKENRPGGTSVPDADALLAALPVAVLIDRDGRSVEANAAFLALTGYESLDALTRAGGRAHLLGGLEASAVASADIDRPFPIIDASGRVVAVEGRLVPVAWRGEAADLLTLRPASDRIAELEGLRFELARREAEVSETRTLLDRVQDAIATVDERGRVLGLNRAAERLFGRDQPGLVGESVGALLTPDSQNAALGAILAARAAGAAAPEARFAVNARPVEAGPLALEATAIALARGRVGLVFRDETQTRDLREALDIARAERDQAADPRMALLATVSHEIRTPLNAILGFAEVMLDERFGPLGNPRYKDYLGDIHAAGRHVIDFMADLMDLSEAETAPPAESVVATNVNQIIRDSVAELQGQAHRDRVIVRLSLTLSLPAALVEEKAMRQVMDSILSNAIRFNEPGGQVIVSTAVTEGGAITVRVRDTGIGMSDAELAVALEPFREIGAGKSGSGSGLGLPLTRALVEANQATLSIRSRKNEGTMVEVVLRPAPSDAAPAGD